MRRLLAAVTAAALFAVAPNALAAQQVITSTGPLEAIYLGDNLSCQVEYAGDAQEEFFGERNPGACGTFLATGGTVYGPDVPAGDPRTAFTVVSQSGVTGTGTATDPYQVVTVVDAGGTGLRVTQTDSYVVGQETYRTNLAVENRGSTATTAAIYHAGDCFLQDSDDGFGWYDSVRGGIYCTVNANNDPAARIVGFVPVGSPGSNYFEGFFKDLWDEIDGTQFSNTCSCDTAVDNGAGLSWSLTIPAGATVQRQLLTAFSPAGEIPDSEPPALTVTSPGAGALVATATPTLSGTAGAAAADLSGVVVRIYAGTTTSGTPVRELTTTRSGGSWSVAATPPLPDGTYTAQAEQSDEAGNVGQSPTTTFTVDTTAPAVTLASPAHGSVIADTTPAVAGTAGVDAGDSGTVRVRIYAGHGTLGAPLQTLDITHVGGAWTVESGALAPGLYTVQAAQSDAAGNGGRSTANKFAVYIAQTGDQPLPPPVLGKQVNLEPLGSGDVYVSLPGATAGIARARTAYKPPVKKRKFIKLTSAVQIPVESLVDVRRGRVRLTTAKSRKGGLQASQFFKGAFKVKQSRKKKRKGLTTLVLIGGDFAGCGTGASGAGHANGKDVAQIAARRRRRLWGRGRGRFRTRGRRGAATVRGTTWYVEDRCDGTFFKVKKGKVRVRDFVNRKTVILRAGDSYFAKKQKPK